LNSRVTASTTVTNIGHRVQFVSPDNFSIFTTYNVAPHLAIPGKLLIGGGVFYNSEYFAASDNITVVPASFSLDALISYEINNIRVALNGYNLTDELNYSSAFSTRAVPSSGRTVVGSVGVRF
jgi:catecholate siderophore receptor